MTIPYAEAVARLEQVALQLAERLSKTSPARSNRVELESAVGRISGADVYGDKTIPPFDNSAMDGFAVTASSTATASEEKPVRLHVLGSIAAGDHPPSYSLASTNKDTCFIINTGAPFPIPETESGNDHSPTNRPTPGPGERASPPLFDACMRKEDARLAQNGSYVECLRPVEARVHRRLAGEDFKPCAQLLRRGDVITAERIAVLASHGVAALDVLARPTIAVLSTGKELEPLGVKSKPPAHIYDSNSHYITSALRQWGLGHDNIRRITQSLGDEPQEFAHAVEASIASQVDVLLTTGGVSKGQHDYIEATLVNLGAQIHFHGVRMRPGHPALLATVHPQRPSPNASKPLVVFSLPGNPGAAAATLRFLVGPFLRSAGGLGLSCSQTSHPPTTIKAYLVDPSPLQHRLKRQSGTFTHAQLPGAHRSYLLGKFVGYNDQGVLLVRTLARGSGMVRPLSEADCWVLVEEDQTSLLVSCYSLSGPM